MVEIEDKITLDRETFKVLSSETRVQILKHLNTRRMTLSSLSKRMGMSVSTIKEHIDILSSAGLIVQKDEGHKWKYCELTRKGRNIVNPVEKKVFIILGLSVIAFIYSAYGYLSKAYTAPMKAAGDMMAERGPPPGAAETFQTVATNMPYPETIFVILSAILAIACVIYLFVRKR